MPWGVVPLGVIYLVNISIFQHYMYNLRDTALDTAQVKSDPLHCRDEYG